MLSPVPGRLQTSDIVIGPGREHERDRWGDTRRETPATEDKVDQRPARAPVAVHERVDRLELGVRDRRLNNRRQRVIAAEGAEVMHSSAG